MIALAPDPAHTPAPWPTAPTRSVHWALAGVESRRLVTHPLFVLGMAISLAVIALSSNDANTRSHMLAGDCFVLFGGALWTFLVAFLAAARGRGDRTEDLYAAAPRRVRTQAALLSLGAAGAAGAAVIALATAVLKGPDGALAAAGLAYTVGPLEMAQGPLYLMLAGACGVLVGTWTQRVFVALAVAVVLFLPPLGLLPWYTFGDSDPRGFYGSMRLDGPDHWHLLRLAGLTALAAAGAMARHDRRRRLAWLALLGLIAALAEIVGLTLREIDLV